MNDFSPVIVKFGSEKKEIDTGRVLEVAARVESALSFGQCMAILSEAATNPESLKAASLAQGYYTLLVQAGFEVSPKQALQSLLKDDEGQNCVDSLMSLFAQFSDDMDNEVKKQEADAPKE